MTLDMNGCRQELKQLWELWELQSVVGPTYNDYNGSLPYALSGLQNHKLPPH